MTGATDNPARPCAFSRSLRLAHDNEYKAVYGARMKKTSGPLVAYSRPNGLAHYRLGLSVGRRIGGAVVRNRAKRLIREAFRLAQHDLPLSPAGGYDLVIGVRDAQGAMLADYQPVLAELAAALHREWTKRAARES